MDATLKGCGSCVLFLLMTFFVYKISLPVFLESFDPEGDVPSDSRDWPKSERTYGGRHILCHKFEGGLGDLLFQYASLLGMNQFQNRLIVASGDLSLQNVLKEPMFRTGMAHCRGVVRLTERSCCHFDNNIAQLDHTKNYLIEGYLQSWKYFKNNEDYVRKHLVFENSLVFKARKIIDSAIVSYKRNSSKVLIVGIHVETGISDKVKFNKFGYKAAPREYFLKVMGYFRAHLKKRFVFLVVSDDIQWYEKNLRGARDVIFAGKQEAAVNLAVMSMVDHCVISVGPISWWAGYFNTGHVVYYKDFATDDSGMLYNKQRLKTDYILPRWVPMS